MFLMCATSCAHHSQASSSFSPSCALFHWSPTITYINPFLFFLCLFSSVTAVRLPDGLSFVVYEFWDGEEEWKQWVFTFQNNNPESLTLKPVFRAFWFVFTMFRNWNWVLRNRFLHNVSYLILISISVLFMCRHKTAHNYMQNVLFFTINTTIAKINHISHF